MIKAVALVNPIGLVSLWACSVDLAMSVVQCVGLSLATHDHRHGGWAHALLSTVVIFFGPIILYLFLSGIFLHYVGQGCYSHIVALQLGGIDYCLPASFEQAPSGVLILQVFLCVCVCVCVCVCPITSVSVPRGTDGLT